jgi:hypothetical protein
LAELLNFEEQQMQGELARLEESSEERAQRMATRARELLRRREEERQAIADAMAEKKWRDSCDIFRAVDSQAFLTKCVQERGKQVEEKKERVAKQKLGAPLAVPRAVMLSSAYRV